MSVSSYRDEECSGTVEHMFDMADVPERVHVAVCEQVETLRSHFSPFRNAYIRLRPQALLTWRMCRTGGMPWPPKVAFTSSQYHSGFSIGCL